MEYPSHQAASFKPEKFPFTVLIRYAGVWTKDELERLQKAMVTQPILHTHSDHKHVVILRRVRPWRKLASALGHARFHYAIVRGVGNAKLPFSISLDERSC